METPAVWKEKQTRMNSLKKFQYAKTSAAGEGGGRGRGVGKKREIYVAAIFLWLIFYLQEHGRHCLPPNPLLEVIDIF